jgi:hypothetical protein
MPGVVGLLGVIALNYARHRRGLPTICSTTRRVLPRHISAAALGIGWLYLAVHVWRGYPKETL